VNLKLSSLAIAWSLISEGRFCSLTRENDRALSPLERRSLRSGTARLTLKVVPSTPRMISMPWLFSLRSQPVTRHIARASRLNVVCVSTRKRLSIVSVMFARDAHAPFEVVSEVAEKREPARERDAFCARCGTKIVLDDDVAAERRRGVRDPELAGGAVEYGPLTPQLSSDQMLSVGIGYSVTTPVAMSTA
jgi:hypothetical protein